VALLKKTDFNMRKIMLSDVDGVGIFNKVVICLQMLLCDNVQFV